MNQREKPKIDLSTLEKILLIRLRRIGDIVMTSPAVAVLKENLPQTSLSYIVEEPYRDLVEGNPHLDKVFVIPKKQRAGDFFKWIRKIKEEHFDALIDFHGGPRASWITLFSGARLKIGYYIQNKGFFYHIKVPRQPEKGRIHSVENHVNLIKALGFEVEAIPPLFVPDATEEELAHVEQFLETNHLKKSDFLVLHIGAGNSYRDWGKDNILAFSNFFSGNTALPIVLVGGSEDRKRGEEIADRSKATVFSAAGKFRLREVKEIIARAVLFVGPDSGPMHIAAATETPMVIYFGPTLPAHFAPWKAEAALIEKDYACRLTCHQKTCRSNTFECLQSITPEEVYKASQKYI